MIYFLFAFQTNNGLNHHVNKLQEDKPYHKSLRVNIELDCIAVFLFVVGLCMRLYRLEEPRSIVYVIYFVLFALNIVT